MKSKEKVEQELVKATERKTKLKEYMTTENRLITDERIRVLKWILSITNKDLEEI